MQGNKNSVEGHPEGCRCMMCNGGMGYCGCSYGHGRHYVLRWILGIIILAIVFCVGVKIGEFKGMYGYGGYGHGQLRQPLYNGNMMYRTGGPVPGMMQGTPEDAR